MERTKGRLRRYTACEEERTAEKPLTERLYEYIRWGGGRRRWPGNVARVVVCQW